MVTGNPHNKRENISDYLWDGSGEPDPEVQRLEALLGRFQHKRQTPIFPATAPQPQRAWIPWRIRWVPMLATAAAAVIIVAVTTFFLRSNKSTPVNMAGWGVFVVEGMPQIDLGTVSSQESPRLVVGQALQTDQASRASLRAEDIGQIDVEANTRLRLLTMGAGLQRIALDRGTIHARIWAPPGQFVVDTPSALTVDLGCAYTLHVDDSGAGLVRTSMGWVGFTLNGHESFIPAGAACATRPKVGPGTPYFEDASPKLQTALARLDFEDRNPQQRAADVATILGESRKRDALTLWHLLARVDAADRARVYDRLQRIAPPPAGVSREGILRLDQPMLDRWWNELGFDDISTWRHWEHSWPEATTPVPTR
jgi:FecR protein